MHGDQICLTFHLEPNLRTLVSDIILRFGLLKNRKYSLIYIQQWYPLLFKNILQVASAKQPANPNTISQKLKARSHKCLSDEGQDRSLFGR